MSDQLIKIRNTLIATRHPQQLCQNRQNSRAKSHIESYFQKKRDILLFLYCLSFEKISVDMDYIKGEIQT